MDIKDPFLHVPVIEAAIEYNPLLISPDTTVSAAIALLHSTRSSSCSVNRDSSKLDFEPATSCVLVMNGEELVGILTARDIVRLSVSRLNLSTVTVAEVMAHPVVTLPLEAFKDLFAAVFLLRRYQIRHLPILDEAGKVIGVVSAESIRRSLQPVNLLKLRKVGDVMSTNAIHAPMSVSVFAIAQLMVKHRISCVIITHEDAQMDGYAPGEKIPVGIITERDIVQFQALGVNMQKMRAQDVMSTPLFLLHPEDSLWKAQQEMQRLRVQRLVVSWDWGRGLGILTQTSLLQIFDPVEMYSVIQSLQQTVDRLQQEKSQLIEKYGDISEDARITSFPETRAEA